MIKNVSLRVRAPLFQALFLKKVNGWERAGGEGIIFKLIDRLFKVISMVVKK